jgi:hypothetical protein
MPMGQFDQRLKAITHSLYTEVYCSFLAMEPAQVWFPDDATLAHIQEHTGDADYDIVFAALGNLVASLLIAKPDSRPQQLATEAEMQIALEVFIQHLRFRCKLFRWINEMHEMKIGGDELQ